MVAIARNNFDRELVEIYDFSQINAKNMMISILLANFNHGCYISEAIEAIIKEQLPDFEFLICDDASIDNSVTIIQAYQAKHPQIHLFCNQKNLGVIASINSLLPKAKGDYLTFVASDDFCLPGFMTVAIGLLNKNPSIGLCCGNPCFFENEKPYVIEERPLLTQKTMEIFSPDELVLLLKKTNFWIPSHACIYRKEAFLQIAKQYEENLHWLTDWYPNYKIAFNTGIGYIPMAGAAMRIRKDSYSASPSTQQSMIILAKLFDLLKNQKYLLTKFKKSGLLNQLSPQSIYYLLKRPRFWSFLTPIFKKKFANCIKRA